VTGALQDGVGDVGDTELSEIMEIRDLPQMLEVLPMKSEPFTELL